MSQSGEALSKNNRFRYSVISATYNCAAYLDETIQSIVNQTLSFTDHIQLVLVNDGSTDNTEEICLKYKELYPQNVVYIHKENGGVSSARNEGLKVAEGEYVNFCDSDDYFDANTMERIDTFRREFGEKSDVICFNIVNFEGADGSWINEKYFEKDAIIDFENTPCFMQHHVGASFIKANIAKSQEFSTNLRILEDGHYLYRIFLQNPSCGVVSGIRYWHRVRKDRSSATQTIAHKQNILSMVPNLFIDLVNRAENENGQIPTFLQNMFIQEFFYYVMNPAQDIQFAQEEQDLLIEPCTHILNLIEDDTIKAYPFLRTGDKFVFRAIKKRPDILFANSAPMGRQKILNFGFHFKRTIIHISLWGFYGALNFVGRIGHVLRWLPRRILWKFYDGLDWFSKRYPKFYGVVKKLKPGSAPSQDQKENQN